MSEPGLKVSRRQVLTAAAGLIVSVSLPTGRIEAQTSETQVSDGFRPDAYVRIGLDSSVTVVVKHVELGQGVYTGLATLVAEELDADWSQVRVEAAPTDATRYGNKIWGGMQGTGGSTSMAASYELMRRAGATVRAMLVQAGGRSWGVPTREIAVADGVISHPSSRRQGPFGAFAGEASRLPVPVVKLKRDAAFGLIGREGRTPRLDTAGKLDGSARYAIDLHEPGMLTVLVARPPRFGAKPAAFDATEALKIKGVVAVRQISSGFAVYAHGMWAALAGRKALKLQWNEAAAETRGSEEMIEQYLEATKSRGIVAGQRGDVDAALAGSEDIVEATYIFPFLAHAPLEPLDGYIRWGGPGAEVRFGCQLPTLDRRAIAQVLGLHEERVKLEVMLAGGSFGHRGSLDNFFAIELAEVARAMGPGPAIKLVWTREDDFLGGFYRPLFVHRLRGKVKDGRITAWSNTLAGQSFVAGTSWAAKRLRRDVDPLMSEGAHDLRYDIPHFRCDAHMMTSAVTTNPWRSVGHSHTCHAVECFVDQLLDKAGKDPVAGRLELLHGAPRLAGVLRAVAALAGWSGPGPVEGRARGVAIVEAFRSCVAQIAEVSLDARGDPKVHKVWCAIDCGIAVNPDIVRAQIEGSIAFGLGHALYAEVPIKNGAPAVSNFHDYRSLTIAQMPEVEVTIVPSAEAPGGVGEPGVPPIAPAVANAVARLRGSHPSRLPIVRP